ncbi:MAG: hypothetical protein ACREPM_14165, partial [Gemmatimonadaceae bacterium]
SLPLPPSRLPDATPTSTAPPSRPRRNKRWVAVQVVVTAVILWYVGKGVLDQRSKFRGVPPALHVRWELIVVATAVYLGGFAVLVETWRRIVRAWGSELTFLDAARIWFVSSLVRYLPWNFVFQLGAVAELSRRDQISPVAATGASVINVAVNIAMGFVIALVAGFRALDTLSHGNATLGIVVAVVLLGGLLALPSLLPVMLRLAQRVTGRQIAIGTLPRRAIYIALAGNMIAWVLYGVAYQALVAGVIGSAPGTTLDYIGVYAAAYVIGYLAFALPAGAVVRETVQMDALPMLGLATFGQAAVIAVSARLWVTVLEVTPALVFLARGSRRQSRVSTPRHGSPP